MKVIKLENRTFCKAVKQEIKKQLPSVKFLRKESPRLVCLLDKDGHTVAMWNQTPSGSRIVLNSWCKEFDTL